MEKADDTYRTTGRGVCSIFEKIFRPLFEREETRESERILRKCLFYQDPPGSNHEWGSGHCNLDKKTRCSGDFQLCQNPEALKKYLSRRRLGWQEKDKIEKPAGRTTEREPLADRVSQSVVQYIHRLSKPTLIAIAFLMTLLVGILGYLTGPMSSCSILYLVPILLVTWFIKRRTGVLMSIVGSVTWLIADLASEGAFSFLTTPYWDGAARLCCFITFTFILSALRMGLEQVKESSKIDFLTGVGNKRYFTELASMEIKRAHRYQHPFTIVYIDLDNFKLTNDRFGHSTGDDLLRVVAKTIQNNIRETDSLARLGGDEFAILLPETGPELAELITRRIQKSSSEVLRKREWSVTLSIGVATFAGPPLTVDEVVNLSDDLMYGAKKEGKNRIKYGVFGEKCWSPVTAA